MMQTTRRTFSRPATMLLALAFPWAGALGHETPAEARYLANEGVLITHGDTRVLFDPLFRESFGHYELLPAEARAALFAGEPPFDGIDAVFISHHHDDHFDPADVRDYLRAQPDVRLYAPRQAADALRAVADPEADAAVLARMTPVDLGVGDAPQRFMAPGLVIDVVRIPHSGWPVRHAEVQNLAWRVTLDDDLTVLHLGDADTDGEHFARDAALWDERRLQLALPPYWFFLSASGRAVLNTRLRPDLAIGIHVPAAIPDEPASRDESLREADLFTRPGESRRLPH